jgi:SAM-dependent methyltransferase
MDAVARYLPAPYPQGILDIGCGTGRFTEPLARRFNARVVGLDPSRKMLEIASAKKSNRHVQFVRGRAESVPIATRSVDLVFISMAFHHFNNPSVAARECRRVSRNGGIIFLRAGTRGQIANYPYVEFIPEAQPLLETRLNGRDEIIQVFREAGCQLVAEEILVQQIAVTHAGYLEKLKAGGDSVLASLTAEERDRGFRRLELHADAVDPRPVLEPINIFVFGR